jgi:nuclease S1
MSDDARAFVSDLLGGSTQSAMASSCTWADEVRATTHRYTSAYHYVNIDPTADTFDFARDCGNPEQRCVTWAIVHYARRLVDSTLSREERAEALKFFCHFIGDVHQPLHAAFASDRGGNLTYLNAWGRRVTLHALWDGVLLARAGLFSPDSIERLDATIPDSLFAPMQQLDPVKWTNESYALARHDVYAFAADSTVTEEYFRHAVAISRERIQVAAARLTLLLDAAAAGTLQFPSAF